MFRDPYLYFHTTQNISLEGITKKDLSFPELKDPKYKFYLPHKFFKYPPFVLMSEEMLKEKNLDSVVEASFVACSYTLRFTHYSLLLPKYIKYYVMLWCIPCLPGTRVVDKDSVFKKYLVKKKDFPSKEIRLKSIQIIKNRWIFNTSYKKEKFPFIPAFKLIKETKTEYVISYYQSFFRGYTEGYGDLFFRTGKNYIFDYILLLTRGNPHKYFKKSSLHSFFLASSLTPRLADRQRAILRDFKKFIKNIC